MRYNNNLHLIQRPITGASRFVKNDWDGDYYVHLTIAVTTLSPTVVAFMQASMGAFDLICMYGMCASREPHGS